MLVRIYASRQVEERTGEKAKYFFGRGSNPEARSARSRAGISTSLVSRREKEGKKKKEAAILAVIEKSARRETFFGIDSLSISASSPLLSSSLLEESVSLAWSQATAFLRF